MARPSRSCCSRSGKLCPPSSPKPAVMLSPKHTMAGRVSAAAAGGAGAAAGCDAGFGAGFSVLPHWQKATWWRLKRFGASECHNKGLIQVRALTKSIDTGTHRVEILKGIDLAIPRGQLRRIKIR